MRQQNTQASNPLYEELSAFQSKVNIMINGYKLTRNAGWKVIEILKEQDAETASQQELLGNKFNKLRQSLINLRDSMMMCLQARGTGFNESRGSFPALRACPDMTITLLFWLPRSSNLQVFTCRRS